MEVINCNSCKESISKQAESCPHCGHTLSDNESRTSTVIKVIAIVVVVGTALLVYNSGLI